jgi:hypothetical protein
MEKMPTCGTPLARHGCTVQVIGKVEEKVRSGQLVYCPGWT